MDPFGIIPHSEVNAHIRYSHRIHYFSRVGNLERVESYLKNGIDIDIQGPFGRTPLHYASMTGNLEIVNMLLNKGAHINACDDMGTTPILEAIKYSRYDVVQTLLDHGCIIDHRAETLAYDNKDFKLLELIEVPIKSALEE